MIQNKVQEDLSYLSSNSGSSEVINLGGVNLIQACQGSRREKGKDYNCDRKGSRKGRRKGSKSQSAAHKGQA